MEPAVSTELMDQLTTLCVAAAAVILATKAGGNVRVKADGSPVTDADLAAQTVIREGIARLAPGLPIVSEEDVRRDARFKSSRRYFLVDPLDGTREFIAGHDDYTVNIALLADGVPVAGVIAAPALGLIWRGVDGRGAERLAFSTDEISPPQAIHVRTRPRGEVVVVVSRSHLDRRTQAYLEGLGAVRTVACGSSLKFCRVAEGSADHYPRLGPTHDWDVAAGHAVLRAAGGHITTPQGAALAYGTPDLLIPGFVAWGGAQLPHANSGGR